MVGHSWPRIRRRIGGWEEDGRRIRKRIRNRSRSKGVGVEVGV